MAHIKHFGMQDVKRLCDEYEREKECNNSDLRIDPERTKYNYTMLPRRIHYQLAYDLPKRVNELPHSNRKDLTVMSTWVVTLPEELKQADKATKRRFFDAIFKYTQDMYGAENVMQGYVHMDESTPHIHMPIVPVDRETGRICRKNVFTPAELKAYHKGLEAVMEKEFGMKGLILNGKTKGNYTTKELKERTRRENELKEREAALDTREADLDARERRFETDRASFAVKVNKLVSKLQNVLDEANYDLEQAKNTSKALTDAEQKKALAKVSHYDNIQDNVDYDRERAERLSREVADLYRDYDGAEHVLQV